LQYNILKFILANWKNFRTWLFSC